MVVRRAQFKLLVVNGELFAVGGDDATTHKTTIEKFNRVQQSWSIVTTFKEQRLMHSSTVAGSKIYIFGGMVSSTKALNTWDAFDVRSNKWDSDLPVGGNEYEDVEEDDYGGVGYDDDEDFYIDFEMTTTSGGTNMNDSPVPALPCPPIFITNNHLSRSSSCSSSSSGAGIATSPVIRMAGACSPSLASTPSSGVVHTSTPSSGGGGIQVSVPAGALKRVSSSGNFSGSLTSFSDLLSRSSSVPVTVASSPPCLSVNTMVSSTPMRSRSDGIYPAHGRGDESPLPLHPGAVPSTSRRSRRRMRKVVPEIDRTIPFTHAFGCAITIPAISFYS